MSQGNDLYARSGQQLTDRELLIRIDERQVHMSRMFGQHVTKTDGLIQGLTHDFHEHKLIAITKGSLIWVITITGGFLGIISVLFTLISSLSGISLPTSKN